MSITPAHTTVLPHRQKGFGLLEVLITVVILAIGLLGLAGLQATGLKYNHSAYNRSQSSILAYDIIDRMRANQVAIANYVTATATEKSNCMTLAGCTPFEMVQNDLFEWETVIAATFAAGTGAISVDGSGTNTTYTVEITWNDDRDGSGNLTFKVSFLP